ncbi:EamA family transporter [Desulfovibrio sulfodismutans]|uniref:EamA family transporter n=1 Tax=Desulfolutivibrio sulfodismutans TaxID=63561 RepID=A0A7K3NJD7_9BACT|nr:DMT family transporter [Desulfolutivibrio sulfodismutans]NDY56217.1 EamA family transporter [Desulfolutivibrio sulfodismutans]QLA12352.1 EamA family transporter [Desulfolutivibrio sulfodismutans DSM 3696]
MNAVVLTLVLLSAVLHVLWNTLVKTCDDRLSFAWLTTVLGGAFLILPFGYVRLFAPGHIDADVWLWAGVSGAFQALYVMLLFAAYGRADLSVVYPVSRGLAPLAVMLFAGRFVGDAVGPLQATAVGLVVAGTVAVGLTTRNGFGRMSRSGLFLCLLTALATAGYSLVDRKAMSLRPAPGATEFLFLSYLFLTAVLTPWALIRRGWRGLFSQWRVNRRDVILVSILTPLSYLCIVAAMGMGNVVLITAGRNVGILFSTLAGAWLLRERVTRGRVFGTGVIFCGLVLLLLN